MKKNESQRCENICINNISPVGVTMKGIDVLYEYDARRLLIASKVFLFSLFSFFYRVSYVSKSVNTQNTQANFDAMNMNERLSPRGLEIATLIFEPHNLHPFSLSLTLSHSENATKMRQGVRGLKPARRASNISLGMPNRK